MNEWMKSKVRTNKKEREWERNKREEGDKQTHKTKEKKQCSV